MRDQLVERAQDFFIILDDVSIVSRHCSYARLSVVSSPDLIRRVYRLQYNAHDTESDPRWGWFWVWVSWL